jgi:hypothetical protein
MRRQRRAQPLLLPVGQNVGKRNGAVRAAFRLFQKADGDRLGDRVARGCLAGVRVGGAADQELNYSRRLVRDSPTCRCRRQPSMGL